jgi:hypothetical protein
VTALNVTFGDGRYRVEALLQGKGLRQLYRGRDTVTGDTVMISYDKQPKHTTIEAFVDTTGARAPGVLDLMFAGPPDDKDLWFKWGVIEQPPRGTEWLPTVLGQYPEDSAADAVPRRLPSFDPATALPNALRLGRTAGRILAENAGGGARRGTLLTRVRPETMWVARAADGALEVRALSQRSELMFAASYVTSFVWPVFDRYYYPPEVGWKRPTVDDRALVFSLSVMIAEWATGFYPFATKDYSIGPMADEQVPLELPERLARLLGAGMRIDPEQRPKLTPFLAELDALE